MSKYKLLRKKEHSETRAYGYIRLSKDEDSENNDSLEIQGEVIRSFAKRQGITLIDIIEDDNCSGYDFEKRSGLEKLKKLCLSGECNTVVVKEQSRLGRHMSKTMLLLDFFKRNDIRYIYAISNHDSFIHDDTYLGINAWVDDKYVKDCSDRQRENVYERQEKRGLIIMPPFGYVKVATTDHSKLPEIVLDDETAFIVKEIFELYISGNGVKAISIMLNNKGYITPNTRKQQITGKPCGVASGLWYHTAVRRILMDESYTGVLVNRKTVVKDIKGTEKYVVEKESRFRHENVYPQLVTPEEYSHVQQLLSGRKTARASQGNKINLFTGFIKCGECGAGYVMRQDSYSRATAPIRKYNCGTYHKLGKGYCTSKYVDERELIEILANEVNKLLYNAEVNHEKIDKLIADKEKEAFDYNKTIDGLRLRQWKLEEQIQNYINEKNEGTIRKEMADKFILKANTEYEQIEEQINGLIKLRADSTVNQTQMLKSIDILRAIVENKSIDRKIVELLVEKIITSRDQNGKMVLDIYWNAPFSYHKGISTW